MVVVFSAYLAGRGVLSWLPVYLVTCFGGTVGFLAMYAVGRLGGRAYLRGGGIGGRLRDRVFPEQRLQRAEGWLRRHGPWLVLGNRFLTGVRSVIALAAGLGGLGWWSVGILGLCSMAIWNALLLYAGMSLGEHWDEVTEVVAGYQRALGVALLAAASVLLARWWLRRRRDIDSQRDRE
jgi:membrane protein DedA with SNARE-associated domain